MIAKCSISGEAFDISEFELDFCLKNNIPLPKVSPKERLRNMLVFRNRVHLYNSTCSASNKKILSCVPPESNMTVYDVELWQSDRWDPGMFARDYAFNRSFFEQLYELHKQVPISNLALALPTIENSDYTNGITNAKNCYLLFGSANNQDCLFSYALWRSKNIVDSTYVFDSELCYSCSDIRNCYNLSFSEHSANCSDSAFLSNCYSCKNCYGCTNLTQKQYCFYNEQLAKAQYQERLATIDLGSLEALRREQERFLEFSNEFPIKNYFGKENQNSTGDYLTNTKNCQSCFFVSNAEDLTNCLYVDNAKSSILHAMFGSGSELIYNCISSGDNIYNLKFCDDCWQSVHDLEYCMRCNYGTNNCFGCIGMKRASYCILNKQYQEQEYFELRDRIKAQMKQSGEYGKFFPIYFSPFYYNQSEVFQFYPLEKEAAIQDGFLWKDDEVAEHKSPYKVPDHIAEVKEDILGTALCCERTGKPFKIIKTELEFLKRQNLPVPRVAPLERIKSRLVFFNLSPLSNTNCNKCNKRIQSVHSGRMSPVYCEDCFQEEVFS